MLATQAAERGCSGAVEITRRHGLSGGNSGHPAMRAPLAEVAGGRRGGNCPGRTSTGRSTGRTEPAVRRTPLPAAGPVGALAATAPTRAPAPPPTGAPPPDPPRGPPGGPPPAGSHRGGRSHTCQYVGFW